MKLVGSLGNVPPKLDIFRTVEFIQYNHSVQFIVMKKSFGLWRMCWVGMEGGGGKLRIHLRAFTGLV
jgi:hypothetical protein